MIFKLIVICGVFTTCVGIHALFSVWSIKVVGPKLQRRGTAWHIVSTMIVIVGLLATVHLLEILLWALAVTLVGAVAIADGPLYFAFTSYTTLGYGDVIAVREWRMIGPCSAMNGILLFGWSTAVIFQVLQVTLRAGHIRD